MESAHNQSRTPRPRMRRAAKAVRSGFRRYPRAIIESIIRSQQTDQPLRISQVLEEITDHDLAVLWLGHATVVAQLEHVTIVVDPVLSDRIGVRFWKRTIGIPRLSPAPIAPESLLDTDLVLLTHAHFDHLDKPTLKAMCSETTTVIVPDRCAKLIPDGFEQVIELKTGESIAFNDLTITAIEPKHWGARSIFDRRRGVNSYLVESQDQCVLFTGDTAHTDAYQNLRPIDLAIFGIGAYDPWDHMHATPEQAWAMFQELDARYFLPIHHSTFELSDEPIEEPMSRLYLAAGADRSPIIEPVIGEIVVIKDTPD